jgi:hypothetical protein
MTIRRCGQYRSVDRAYIPFQRTRSLKSCSGLGCRRPTRNASQRSFWLSFFRRRRRLHVAHHLAGSALGTQCLQHPIKQQRRQTLTSTACQNRMPISTSAIALSTLASMARFLANTRASPSAFHAESNKKARCRTWLNVTVRPTFQLPTTMLLNKYLTEVSCTFF